MSELCGVLVLDKPAGPTSAQVVARVKHALGVGRVGHTGTLDPLATGVLPICVGEATKIAGALLAADKGYEGAILLGVETTTLDAAGEVTRRNPAAAASLNLIQIQTAARAMEGSALQVPPMVSAVRQGGKRLYELFRAGQDVVRSPRPIVVRRFEITGLGATPAGQPQASFRIDCSKGTYVRVLAADLGSLLGCGAHLAALRRIYSGFFDLSMAMSLEEVVLSGPGVAARLIDPAHALAHLPACTVTPAMVASVRDGRPLAWTELAGTAPWPPPGLIRLLTPDGKLLALVEAAGDPPRLAHVRGFRYGLTAGPASPKVGPNHIERGRKGQYP
jgi:tRNA pseudouridine55 synthase